MDESSKLKNGKAKKLSGKILRSVFLTSDVEEYILSGLPVKSLGRFRCVCKHWYNLITKPHFIKMQLNRSTQINEGFKLVFHSFGRVYFVDDGGYGKQYIKTNAQNKNHMLHLQKEQIILPFRGRSCDMSLRISGSCDGILLLSDSREADNVYLLNPATREYKRLPNPEIIPNREPFSYPPDAFLGFGYSPRTDQYKVIMIRWCERTAYSVVCVYTLGTNSSWRSIEGTAHQIFSDNHALVNGALHWMLNSTPIVLISFDLGDEEFRELSLPKSFTQQDILRPMGCVNLGGFLSFYHYISNGNLEIWIMKDYGDEQSWTKEFSVPQRMWLGFRTEPYIPLGILKKDEGLLFENGCGFCILDLVTKRIIHLHLKLDFCPISRTIMYSESLVSLGTDGGMGGDNKQGTREKEGERSAEYAKAN